MAPSWRDPDLLPRVAIALPVGQSAAYVALPCHDCVSPLLASVRRGRGGEHNLLTVKESKADLHSSGSLFVIHSGIQEAWFTMTHTNLIQ